MTQKPTIKIDGVEISQTTTYIDYDTWAASPLTKALNNKLDAAVLAEREACAKVAEAYEPRCDICPSGVANAIRARGEKK
jgi:hypothetical protein